MEAPKPKRLVVAPGHTAWWGVDPSTARVALATVDGEGHRAVSMVPFAAEAGAHRLAGIFTDTRALAVETARLLAPGVIAVEQPSAPKQRGVNPWLYKAVGVIEAALVAGVLEATGRRPEVAELVSVSWKALAVGKGNIGKPAKDRLNPRPEDYLVLRWARSLGYQGSSWDCADAYGIAEWARRTYELTVR